MFERETGLSRLRLDGPEMEMFSNKSTAYAVFFYYLSSPPSGKPGSVCPNNKRLFSQPLLFERETGLPRRYGRGGRDCGAPGATDPYWDAFKQSICFRSCYFYLFRPSNMLTCRRSVINKNAVTTNRNGFV